MTIINTIEIKGYESQDINQLTCPCNQCVNIVLFREMVAVKLVLEPLKINTLTGKEVSIISL